MNCTFPGSAERAAAYLGERGESFKSLPLSYNKPKMSGETAFCSTSLKLFSKYEYTSNFCSVRRSVFVHGMRRRHWKNVGGGSSVNKTLFGMSEQPKNEVRDSADNLSDSDVVDDRNKNNAEAEDVSKTSKEGDLSPAINTLNVPAVEKNGRQKKRYSMRARLREETEAPFRKFRMFIYMGSGASAGVGAFISSLRIISALVGTRGVQPLSETVPNVAIDLGVVGLSAFMFNLEIRAGEKRLERMSRGARIAKLRLQDVATRQVVLLKDLRGSKRIVIVAGGGKAVEEALQDAEPQRDELEESSLRVVPLVISDGTETATLENAARGWRFIPFFQDDWHRWYEEECQIIGKRLNKNQDVVVVVIRLDGKVGARTVGKPVWSRLVEEVKRLPPKDQYGKP